MRGSDETDILGFLRAAAAELRKVVPQAPEIASELCALADKIEAEANADVAAKRLGDIG